MTTVKITKRKLRYLYRTLRKHDKESKELNKLIVILKKDLENKFKTVQNNVEENIVYLHSTDIKQ